MAMHTRFRVPLLVAISGCGTATTDVPSPHDAITASPNEAGSASPGDAGELASEAGPSDAAVPGDDAADAGSNGPEDAARDADAGTSAPCVTGGTELCDDFESGHIDPAKWMAPKPSSGVTIALDGQQTHSGHYAVHVHGVAGQQNKGILTESLTFPAKNNSFYARMFAYFSPDLPAMDGGDFHTGFIFGSGNNDKGNVETGMGLIGGAKQFLGYSIFYGSPSYEFGPWSNTRVTPNRWICMELLEDGSNPKTEVRRIWVDDVELTDLRSDSAMAAGSSNPNHLSPTYDLVSVGLAEFHPSPNLTDMWFDDVRVSSAKIGCKD
jgi:hypothetical protein